MTILNITEAAKAAGVSRTTIYEKINDGELSRTPDGIDTVELLRVFGDLKGNDSSSKRAESTVESGAVEWHREKIDRLESRLDKTEQQLEQSNATIAEKDQALIELRQAYNALPSPEDVNARIKKEVEKVEQEKLKAIAQQKQQSEKWKAALGERQREIEAARREAELLKQQATDDIARIERRAAGERAVREALENRGLIARLLNKKPVVDV